MDDLTPSSGTDAPAPPDAPAPTPAAVVLFDLDGTLVDPGGAITGGIAAALKAHGIPVPEPAVLDAMVGPPLAESLLSLPEVRESQLPGIVEHYRQEYLARGMAASTVYPGIRELLGELRAAGAALAVATSKPQPLAERLLEVQGLATAFDAISGSHPDESIPHSGKGPILAAALQALNLGAENLGPNPVPRAMVGDRVFDVEGAQAHGIPCIGVRWGYAPVGELEEAGAQIVVKDAAGLRTALDAVLDGVLSGATGGRMPEAARGPTASWHLTESRP
ncbi:HAD hydrolase-like protein [Nesterenkonia sp. HG001]|uniref:HAD hydrolase-like protein n=1 Tax=Nesterenkonia sp. HG001 TaxID=2983207 RepID=UPI002AC44FAD|nr:HAD hydrolase-like protein [Nesterenkonia sp. HG001]MDZ5078025.1 HAD hydrolase-like protein [Nesterenkonia sp. HG001]